MFVKIGGFRHPVNEVNTQRVQIRHRLSPRNKRLTTSVTLHLWGELQEPSQSGLTAAIRQFLDAYENDYEEIGLYQDDGTRTPHYIDNVNSISGVKILYRDWPLGDAAEYATKRTFRVHAYSEYANVDSQLVFWKERVRLIGNGGPRRRVKEFFTGPVEAITQLRTKQVLIQSGESIGFQGYVSYPSPLFPASVVSETFSVEEESPENQGLTNCFYKRKWSYTHVLVNQIAGAHPNVR